MSKALYAFLESLSSILRTVFLSNWLLSDIKTLLSDEKGMNPLDITTINRRNEEFESATIVFFKLLAPFPYQNNVKR